MSGSQHLTSRGALNLIGALLIVASAAPVGAQVCLNHVDTLIDTSYTCVTEPFVDRAFSSKTFRWKNHDYLIVSHGNEASIWNIDDPANPDYVTKSRFRFGNAGDSDYDLNGFQVCDDCRFAYFSHKVAQTVIVDFGTGAIPSFDDWATYPANAFEIGGFTFSKGAPDDSDYQEYLVADGMSGECAIGATLYTIDGVEMNQIKRIGCITNGEGTQIFSKVGVPISIDNEQFLLLSVDYAVAGVYRMLGTGADFELEFVTNIDGLTPERLSLDSKKMWAVSAHPNTGVVSFWRFSDSVDPENPVVATRFDDGWIDGLWTEVRLKSPTKTGPAVLFLDKRGYNNAIRTFLVESSGVTEFASEDWTNPDLEFNLLSACKYNTGGSLSPDGTVLYLSRASWLPVFDLSECIDPEPAEAGVTYDRLYPFPGETVRVSDDSHGSFDQWAVWVTEEPSGTILPDMATTPDGDNPRWVEFELPVDLFADVSYTAHVEINNTLPPPVATPTAMQVIDINRAPSASYSIAPETYVIGTEVELTAVNVEGSPDFFRWSITPPDPEVDPYERTGNPVFVDLNSGDQDNPWQIVLTVEYQHTATEIELVGNDIRYGNLDSDQGDDTYKYEVAFPIEVSSVGANFTIIPSSPKHTETITLQSTSAAADSANLVYDWNVLTPSGAEVHKLVDECDGPADPVDNAQEACEIPADTLDPGTYDFQLILHNGEESDEAFRRNVVVRDGNISVDFTASPSTADIGESVTFIVIGVESDVDIQTEWDFDGAGCGDSNPEVRCNELFGTCRVAHFSYRDSGPKNVKLIVKSFPGGVELGRAENVVNVGSSGQCDEAPCTQTVSPLTRVLTSTAQQSSFEVESSSSGCSWTAQPNSSWISLVSGSSGTGDRTVTFSVTANTTGNKRYGSISVGFATFSVTQNPVAVAADFTISPPNPQKGEIVTFTAVAGVDVTGWHFDEPDCQQRDPDYSCGHLCQSQFSWTFRTDGTKEVKMFVAGQTDPIVRTFTVRDEGECCTAERKPIASFSSTAEDNTAYVGQTVVFTDTSSKHGWFKDGGIELAASRLTPDKGVEVQFEVSGVDNSVVTVWDFDGEGCDSSDQTPTCVPNFGKDCRYWPYTYSESGPKVVTVTVYPDQSLQDPLGSATVNLTVSNNGNCPGDDGGGGGGGNECSFDLSPSSVEISPNTWTNSFEVDTDADCEWTPTSSEPWVTVVSGNGPGPGTVEYSVEANPGSTYRDADIVIGDVEFTVTQRPAAGDVAPTAWLWTVTRTHDAEDNPIPAPIENEAGAERILSYDFVEAGWYDVKLTASNCGGSDTEEMSIQVISSPIEDFVVAAAVSSEGANSTRWESEFRFFNPCDEDLQVKLFFQPHETDNSGKALLEYPFTLGVGKTEIFDNIQEMFPQLGANAINGSVKVETTSPSGCKAMTVSRTFNQTANGTLGLFVPSLPIRRLPGGPLNLIGLIEDGFYRTNIRFVNNGDVDAWVRVTLYNKNGTLLQFDDGNGPRDFRLVLVKGHSTKQINEIASWYGYRVGDEMFKQPFTVRAVPTQGANVDGFATMVDNTTGDSVLFQSDFTGENKVWVVGLAHLEGVSDSRWRSDLYLSNPTDNWLPGEEAEFVVGDSPGEVTEFSWPNLGTYRIKQYVDIVGVELGLDETRGYVILNGKDGGPAPQVAARTYSLGLAGGTYGLNLPAFGADDLLYPGETGYIVGISNSADEDFGYRTNLGILNTDRDVWTRVHLTLIGVGGFQIGSELELLIAPGVLRQFDVAKKFGVSDVTGSASIKIEVTEGGAVAAYATEIDNLSQDSIFIPAQGIVFGSPKIP